MMANSTKLALSSILLVAASFFTINALIRQKSAAPAAPTAPQANYILYTLPGCPHCQNVREYIAANNISSKVEFADENAGDPAISQELTQRAAICGIPQGQVGVPLLWDAANSKCLVGDTAIIDFFAGAAGLTPPQNQTAPQTSK